MEERNIQFDDTYDFESMEQTAPILTLYPEEEPVPAAPDFMKEIKKEPAWEEPVLTAEERQMVDAFAKQIDITNSTQVMQYGVGTQKKMADFSENILGQTRNKDFGEVGTLIAQLSTEIRHFDEAGEEKKFSFFRKTTSKIDAMKAQYTKTETSIENICTALEGHQVQLMKDVAIFDKMYDLNLTYFKELSMYLLAGKKKLAETREGKLRLAEEKARKSGLPEDIQAANDIANACNRFEKKLYDIETTRMVAIQTAPQIRIVQSNDTETVEKIQSIMLNTIPLWKNQMVLALGLEHSAQAARAQRQVTDLTNELLRRNAETLKLTTVEVAKASERSIVDLETLKATNASLISTLEEVQKIQEDGRQKRKAAEIEIAALEDQLKNALLKQGGRG